MISKTLRIRAIGTTQLLMRWEGFTRPCHGQSADSGEMGGGGRGEDQKPDRRGAGEANWNACRRERRRAAGRAGRASQVDRRGGRNEIGPRGPGRTSGRLRSVVLMGATPAIDRLDRDPQRRCFPLRERPLPSRRRHYGATLARVKQFFALGQVFSGPQEFCGRDARIAVTLRSIDRERKTPTEDSPVHLSLNP